MKPGRGLNLRTVSSALLCAALLVACRDEPATPKFTVGMSKSILVVKFGEPAQSIRMTKHSEAIWGAIESYWSTLDVGDDVTIWQYPGKDGTWELYFRNDDTLLNGVAFAPEGVIY